MATDFIYPTAAELQEIAQDKIPRLTAQRPIFDIFPMVDVDDSVLMWEQKDNYVGLQQIRGINGAAPKVKRVGGKRYLTEPGIYGEFAEIDERELTRRRQYGTFGNPISIDDLVMEGQDQLLGRRLDRIELIGWTLLATGTFSVSGLLGSVLHTDSYTLQTFSASPTWATHATATPLADFRAIKLKARGHSVRFDASAKAYMNSATANDLYANTNAADLYGRRVVWGAASSAAPGPLNSPAQVNALLQGDNLPQIVEYDEGYLDDSNTFQLFIPNNTVVVVGGRPNNQPVADYAMTRNANNPSLAPGAYMKVIDRGEDTVPRSIEVHDGHNGAPRIWFPSAVVVATV